MSRKRKHRNKNEAVDELNLIPVMNLFVCLVPFLLLTAAFVKMGGIDVELPKAQAAQTDPGNEKKKTVDLIFQMDGNQVVVTGYTNSFAQPIQEINATFGSDDQEILNKYLNVLAEKHEKIGASLFKANEKTKFEDAVKVLTTLRKHEALKAVVLATDIVE